jgi:hypothetical protein
MSLSTAWRVSGRFLEKKAGFRPVIVDNVLDIHRMRCEELRFLVGSLFLSSLRAGWIQYLFSALAAP